MLYNATILVIWFQIMVAYEKSNLLVFFNGKEYLKIYHIIRVRHDFFLSNHEFLKLSKNGCKVHPNLI